MKINKITCGFVIQTFDTKKKKFISQEFCAGDEETWETEDGEPVEDEPAVDLEFDMIQP